jgi:hypothetical protein
MGTAAIAIELLGEKESNPLVLTYSSIICSDPVASNGRASRCHQRRNCFWFWIWLPGLSNAAEKSERNFDISVKIAYADALL